MFWNANIMWFVIKFCAMILKQPYLEPLLVVKFESFYFTARKVMIEKLILSWPFETCVLLF
jgi:hypothetical protein